MQDVEVIDPNNSQESQVLVEMLLHNHHIPQRRNPKPYIDCTPTTTINPYPLTTTSPKKPHHQVGAVALWFQVVPPMRGGGSSGGGGYGY